MKLSPLPSALGAREFIAAYGGVYESSPWVAECVWPQARSGALDEAQSMSAAIREIVDRAGREKQLALLRAHPELAGRAAIADMTDASMAEQSGAGLDRCSPQEYAEFMELNRRYNDKFGFPFIAAVKGRDRRSILTAFRERIDNGAETEFGAALEQVHRIAEFRLAAMTEMN